MPPFRLSVIIPTLNEAAQLGKTLEAVERLEPPPEVLVVDGGSEDETEDVATGRARWLTAPRGRAAQMNTGARAASGDVLLFLHADTLLPPDAAEQIARALAAPRVGAGTFRLAFDRPTPLLRLFAACTWLPLPQLCFGDRALFVRRACFELVGGFPQQPLFEDLEMVRRLCRVAGFRIVPRAVVTSARRFERHGPLRQQWRNLLLWLHWLAGTPPDRLAHRYGYHLGERG